MIRAKAEHAAPRTDAGVIAAFAPAIALALVGLVALGGNAMLKAGQRGQFLVLTHPGLAAAAVLDMVHRAGGGVIADGGLPGLVIALSDQDDFKARARDLGAWLVMPAPGDFGCVAAGTGVAR